MEYDDPEKISAAFNSIPLPVANDSAAIRIRAQEAALARLRTIIQSQRSQGVSMGTIIMKAAIASNGLLSRRAVQAAVAQWEGRVNKRGRARTSARIPKKTRGPKKLATESVSVSTPTGIEKSVKQESAAGRTKPGIPMNDATAIPVAPVPKDWDGQGDLFAQFSGESKGEGTVVPSRE